MALISEIELIVLRNKTQFQYAHLQIGMTCPRPTLTSIGSETVDWYSQGRARIAAITIRTISKHAAATEAVAHEFRICLAVDQVTRRRDLRACLPVRQVTAWIGCRCIKLQGMQRKLLEMCHVDGKKLTVQ